MNKLSLTLLGRPFIKLDGSHLLISSSKAQALLFYLAVSRHPHSRQELAGLLWPDIPEENARTNLRGEIMRLRDALGDLIVPSRRSVALAPGEVCTVDVAEFERLIKRPQPEIDELKRAAELYQGEFLTDFQVPRAAEFENWILLQREYLRSEAIKVLFQLARYTLAQQEYTTAITYLHQLLRIEPWLEEAHRGLMAALAYSGQRTAALAQFDICRTVLIEELGVEPDEETEALYHRILAGDLTVEMEAADNGMLASVRQPAIPPFQPPTLTPHFVGREEIALTVAERLLAQKGSKQVALVGMGGLGKTTAAIYISHQLQNHFVDGVLWGSLATSEPREILERWAEAYGRDFSGLTSVDDQAAAIAHLLANKETLVVLDDMVSAARIRPLLAAAGNCPVLVTTRDSDLARRLNLHVIPLLELAPQEGYALLVKILGEERVEEEKAAALEICDLLQNLPLAVELAAQRMKDKRRRLADVARRLRNQAERLGLEVADRAVRTSFAVSWDILPLDLKEVFALLAVFGGRSFSPKALAAVATIADFRAEDQLFYLADLSLVREDFQSHRYQQHPLLADFAVEKLIEMGKWDEGRGRMSHYFQVFAAEHHEDYDALRPEWPNLMAGMAAAHELQAWQLVVDYARALEEPWFRRGRFSEARHGYALLEQAAEQLGQVDTLADCWIQWACACIEQHGYAAARELLEKCLAAAVSEKVTSTAQYHLARIALEQNDSARAADLLTLCQASREKMQDAVGVAAVKYCSARIAFKRGNFEKATELAQSALAIQQEHGDLLGAIRTLRVLASAAVENNDFAQAERYGLEALTLCEQLKSVDEKAYTLYPIAATYRRQRQLEKARQCAQEAYELLVRIGGLKLQGLVLYELSIIEEFKGDLAKALELGEEALAVLRGVNDQHSLVLVMDHLSDLYVGMRQLHKAKGALAEGIAAATKIGHERLVNSLRQKLGRI